MLSIFFFPFFQLILFLLLLNSHTYFQMKRIFSNFFSDYSALKSEILTLGCWHFVYGYQRLIHSITFDAKSEDSTFCSKLCSNSCLSRQICNYWQTGSYLKLNPQKVLPLIISPLLSLIPPAILADLPSYG